MCRGSTLGEMSASRVAMPKVGARSLGWAFPATGLGCILGAETLSFSQTSAAGLRVGPSASSVTALKKFVSGSCIPSAGRTAASPLLARGELAFPFAEPQPVLFPGSPAVLCKTLCCWRQGRCWEAQRAVPAPAHAAWLGEPSPAAARGGFGAGSSSARTDGRGHSGWRGWAALHGRSLCPLAFPTAGHAPQSCWLDFMFCTV